MLQNFLSEHFHDLDEIATYTTDNIYQLYQYTRALKPKVLIFNIKDESSLADLQSIINTEQNNYPLIVLISPQMQIPNFPQIAHYILRDDKKRNYLYFNLM